MREAQSIGRIGSWELDLETNAFSWSEELLRVFRVAPDGQGASLGPLIERIHPEDQAAVVAAFMRSVESREPFASTHRLLLPDSGVRWVHSRCETHYDVDGRPIRAIGTVQDVTARILAEQELREARDLLRAVIDTSPDAIFVKDAAHRYLLANETFARRLGSTPGEIVGRRDADLFPPDLLLGDPAKGVRGTREVDRAVFEGTSVSRTLNRSILPDGTNLIVESLKLPLRDASGKVYALLGIARDVTEARRIEADLRESEARFRTLLEGLPDAVLVLQDGRYVYANAMALQMFGYGCLEDLVGLSAEDVVAPALEPDLREARIDEGPTSPVEERRGLRRDGTHLPLEVSTMGAQFGGRPAQVIVPRDISQRRELAARAARMDRVIAVGTLAAGIGHEINNPLAFVLGNIELASREIERLAATALPHDGSGDRPLAARFEELETVLSEARQGAERIRDIVHDLRSFSRAGEEEHRSLALLPVVESAANMAWNQVRHRARVVKEYAPVPDVDANESKLAQVFLNLLINAAQAIPEGRAEDHEVRIVTRTDERSRAVVEVHDTGAGIASDVLPRIFDAFFTTKPIGAGIGLGLSICQSIVRSMGGDITVQSRAGQTMFRVTLPRAESASAVSSVPRPSNPPPGERARIFVVDDEPMVVRMLLRTLSADYDVSGTTRGAELLERLERGERFGAVLCDLMMPELTGMDVYAAVAARFPDQAPRMVFITGGAFTSRARQFVEERHIHVLEKPFSTESVLLALRRVLG